MLNEASVVIYASPNGDEDGDVTQHDLRTNGDVILVQEVRTFRGERWFKVRITAGRQENERYKMPDSVGWFRERDVSKSKTAPAAPPSWLTRLQNTIDVQRVVDGSTFVIYLKPGFWGAFDAAQQRTIAKGHFDTVWRNRPSGKAVKLMQGRKLLAESGSSGQVNLR